MHQALCLCLRTTFVPVLFIKILIHKPHSLKAILICSTSVSVTALSFCFNQEPLTLQVVSSLLASPEENLETRHSPLQLKHVRSSLSLLSAGSKSWLRYRIHVYCESHILFSFLMSFLYSFWEGYSWCSLFVAVVDWFIAFPAFLLIPRHGH